MVSMAKPAPPTPPRPRRPRRPTLGDLLAGISVAMIAVPQALAYAELAGMPAYTGLYAVALPAVGAALFVSSPYLQTGPVATTSLLTLGVLSAIAVPGDANYVVLAALLAVVVGAVRILVGLMGLGGVAYLLAQPVLMGFMSAAAILITFSQLPTALGAPAPASGVMGRGFWTLLHPGAWDLQALLLTLATLLLVLGGRRLHRLFPGVLIAVLLGLLFSSLAGYQGATIGAVPTGLPRLSFDFPLGRLPDLLLGGVVIALVGFSEAASISRTFAAMDRSRWNPNREFISQGVANVLSGISGGFPVGASFSRSAVNRLAGARSAWSGAITGMVVLAVLPFVDLLSPLPKAVLGAIVIAAVLSLLRLRQLWRLRRYSRPQALIAWTTFGLTLVLSPRIEVAVLLGIGLAIAQHLRREQQLVIEYQYDDAVSVLHITPKGVLWFGSAWRLEETFTDLLATYPTSRSVQLHLGGLGRIDLSAAMMLANLIDDANNAGVAIELREVPPMARRWVERLWQDALGSAKGSARAKITAASVPPMPPTASRPDGTTRSSRDAGRTSKS